MLLLVCSGSLLWTRSRSEKVDGFVAEILLYNGVVALASYCELTLCPVACVWPFLMPWLCRAVVRFVGLHAIRSVVLGVTATECHELGID